jgi:peptidoglycan-associated lipoprotein
MKFVKTALVVSMISLVLNGCSSKGGAQGEDAAGIGTDGGMGGAGGPEISRYGDGGAGGGAYGNGASGYGAGGAGAGGTGDPALDDPSSPLSKRVIYFMYDSYQVLPEYQQVLNAHATYLASHPNRTVVLEGHADERGSPEYNIALGEQRGKAVSKMMQLQGVASNQLQVVSFGEEKPAVSGHDESAWQQNRRVEISYSGR